MTALAQEATPPAVNATRPFAARERWILLVASAWLVIGLQLDAYAHATEPELETFWTPWHGVLYSGIAASGFTLLWIMRPRLPLIPTYRTVLALPKALLLPLIGMALLLVGGGIDTLWHNIFGIEKGMEIFVSPSHEMIIAGMVLVAMGPALMLATAPGGRITAGGYPLVLISTLFSVLPLHIYSLHASTLGTAFFGRGDNPVDVFGRDAQQVHGYLFTTALLLVPILLIGRRWQLPVGLPTLLVAVPALLMHLMFQTGDPWWPNFTVAAAAAGTELLLRLLTPLVNVPEVTPGKNPTTEVRWALLGFAAPPLVWGTEMIVAASKIGVGWDVHMVSGILTLTAITGLLTTLATRNIRPAR